MAKDNTLRLVTFLRFGLSQTQIDALTLEQVAILELPYIEDLISKGKLLTTAQDTAQDKASRDPKARNQQSAENALALSKDASEHLNHLGLWTLIEAGMIDLDRAKTITPAQVEILDNEAVQRLLGIQVIYPSMPVSKYTFGLSREPDRFAGQDFIMPLEATFSREKAEITLERALTLTPEQVAFIKDADPRTYSPLSLIMAYRSESGISYKEDSQNPYMLTLEKALSSPAGALDAVRNNVEDIRKRRITVDDAIALAALGETPKHLPEQSSSGAKQIGFGERTDARTSPKDKWADS